jgi:glycosyltransferase involved in cell wall biosynthesis
MANATASCQIDRIQITMPMVSVIIPNYNHAQFLRRRIDSVLNQTYRDFEVFVLDDASSDDSQQVLESYADYPQIEMCLSHTNSGSTFAQWNKGVHLARGKYIWIAESDDYADSTFLEKLVPVLDEHPRTVLVKARSLKVDEHGRRIPNTVEDPATRDWQEDFIIDGREDCRLQLEHGNSVTNASAVLFRRQVYLDVGGADETFRMCGDWLLWAKMMMEGDFAYRAEPLNRYRFHKGSVRSACLANGIREIEDLKVCRYLLKNLRVSRDEVGRVCNRIVKRWIGRALVLSGSRIPFVRNREIFRILREIDNQYAWHICKQVVLRGVAGGIRCCRSGR